MSENLNRAIEAVRANQVSFCKFVSANDAGDTGGHQAGLYIPKNSIKLLFDIPGIKGENKEKLATLVWQDGTEVVCRFIYYGKGSRNEYRITRLGKHFKVGDFIIIVKINENIYQGFYLSIDTDIEKFLEEFDLSISETNNLITVSNDTQIKLFDDSGTKQKTTQNIIPKTNENTGFNFRPRARIIKIIGQELISNDVIALVELIKNSYDADALNVEIELNNIFSSNGEIIIKDDGLGMSYEKIVNVWLEPATPDKKNILRNKFSKCYERRLLGEKGIGRFAAHRLGNLIELSTRAKDECDSIPLNYETHVKIDWEEFGDDKYLNEVPISVTKNTPLIYPNDSGTFIKISDIQPWKNFKSVKDAILKIRGLESPVKPKNIKQYKNKASVDPGIHINITSNDIELNRQISELKSLGDLLDTAFYRFHAVIFANGDILYDYFFDRPDSQDIKRSEVSKKDNLIAYNLSWFEENELNYTNTPGEFEVNFYAWDLEAASLKVAGLADYYRNVIKPNAGVRIYRDNFRVWPYGEEDNDWLNLDLARLNAPKERTVSRNQIFGVVHVSSTENADLKDQSNREGLIINKQYEQFYNLVSATLTLFAKERKADKIRIDKVTKTESFRDIVSQSIDSLKNNVEKNNHQNLYKESIEKIEQSYHGRINDLVERYMMAAAIGISYSIPIHEMKNRLSSIKHIVEDIDRNPEFADQYLRKLIVELNNTDDIIGAVSSIMSRQKKQKLDLIKIANNVRVLKVHELSKFDIKFEIVEKRKIEIEAVPGLLNTAVLNLVDNAIYWLRVKKIEHKKENYIPKITIEIGDNGDCYYFSVIDNGNGFTDPLELLIEPYYSHKSDGLGLGLYLTNEIMIRLGGRLFAYNDNGAIFQLLFKK